MNFKQKSEHNFLQKLLIIICAVMIIFSIVFCVGVGLLFRKSGVIIFTSMEDFRQELLETMLKQKFPELDISVQYIGSGNSASRLKAEGSSIEADIIMELDYGYLGELDDYFVDLSDIINIEQYIPEFVPKSKRYIPLTKFSVGVVINTETMEMQNLPIPQSYVDLLNPIYRGNISMPSPKASGTGYGFYKGLVDYMGEENALNYFEEFQKNVKHFTSSGSGPVNNLRLGETAIGIALIFQSALERNSGVPLQLLNFEEGYPYNISGMGIVNGHENKNYIKEVFNYVATEFNMADKINNVPEKIFKEQGETVIANFPPFANMDMKEFSNEEKERLLNKWIWS